MRILSFIIFLLFFFFKHSIYAQEVDDFNLQNPRQNLDTLKTILVTASKIPSQANTSGKTVSIITADDLKNIPANSLDEIIKWTTGVNVNTRQPFGVQADIGIRGSTFSQVLFLIDGIRQNDPLTSHFNSNIPINKSNIDRIEIIKGAATAAYGADAVAGVIHIKTKTFTSDKNDPNNSNIVGEIAIGRDELMLSNIGIVKKTDTYHQSLSLNISNAKGEKIQNPAYNLKDIPQNTPYYRNSFNILTITTSRAFFLNKRYTLFLRIGYDKRNVGAKYFYTNSLLDESTENMDLVHTQVALSRKTENSSLMFNFGHRTMHDIFTFNSNFPSNTHRTLLSVASLDYSLLFSPTFTLLMGTQAFFKDIQSSDRGNHNDYSSSVYINLKYAPLNKVYLHFGQRFNYDTNYGTAWIPQINISFIPTKNVTFRLGGGKAIRAADYTERFVSYNIPNLSEGRNIGNPNLVAEETYSYDLGIELKVNKTELSFSWFHRFGNQIIDFIQENERNINNLSNLQQGKNYIYAKNIENVNTNGVEMTISKVFFQNKKSLIKVKTGYSFLNTNYNDDIKSKNLYHPRHIANAMFFVKYSPISIKIYYNYYVRDIKEQLSIDGKVPEQYGVMDTRINYQFISQLSIFIQANNLFDTNYQEILGAKMPSRWIAYGISWKLK